MYPFENEMCWQCGGDKTIDKDVCSMCQRGIGHSKCDNKWTEQLPCPICCESNDDNEQEEFSYAE